MKKFTYGKGKCIDCPKNIVRNSPNHRRCKKCSDNYRNSTQPERDTLLLTTADEPKKTWGRRMPNTISRSQVVRRNRAKKIEEGRYRIKYKNNAKKLNNRRSRTKVSRLPSNSKKVHKKVVTKK